MFTQDIYYQRRKELSDAIGHGVVLFLGNEDLDIHYDRETRQFSQESSFFYYFGVSRPHLAAIIDIDLGRTAIFGDDPKDDTFFSDSIQTLRYEAAKAGVLDVLPYRPCLWDCFRVVGKQGRKTHFLPAVSNERLMTLSSVLGVAPENLEPSRELVDAVKAQRQLESLEEI